MRVDEFTGAASLAQAGAQLDRVGGTFVSLGLHQVGYGINLPNGPGFSLGLSGTVGVMHTFEDLHDDSYWRIV